MSYLGKMLSNVKDLYNEINPATLTGAIDVIVIQQPDGTYKCSPFHVRFGKIGVLRFKEKFVDVEVNGEPIDIQLQLGENGEINLSPDSDQIASFNLNPGPNEVEFSVTTAYQGTTRCLSIIYLWQYNDKIVISDIDGTITKSDVLGQLLPMLGKDWAQSGVASLFTKIYQNGYKFLYLSARAIGQSSVTRGYLKSVKQDEVRLPDGPLLLSPTSLLSAFHREVIEKKPEVFKIECLTDIKSLFPSNPFFAGFGNKVNDVNAYSAVDIPRNRTFTINHNGVLTMELPHPYQSTYICLIDVVDQMFPPLNTSQSRSFSSDNEYGQFKFWRNPIPDLTLDDMSLFEDPKRPTSKNGKHKLT